MKFLKAIKNWFKTIVSRYKTKKLIKEAEVKLETAYQKQLIARKALRKNINEFLYEYYGVNKKSKYIPHDFKNAEEVKAAVTEKFNDRMNKLSLSYEDLFR